MVLSPDGKYAVATFSANYPDRGESEGTRPLIRVYDLERGKEVRHFLGHKVGVDYLAFTPDGKFVLSQGRDNTYRLWNFRTGKQVRSL
jgi:WD40 repeat protein